MTHKTHPITLTLVCMMMRSSGLLATAVLRSRSRQQHVARSSAARTISRPVIANNSNELTLARQLCRLSLSSSSSSPSPSPLPSSFWKQQQQDETKQQKLYLHRTASTGHTTTTGFSLLSSRSSSSLITAAGTTALISPQPTITPSAAVLPYLSRQFRLFASSRKNSNKKNSKKSPPSKKKNKAAAKKAAPSSGGDDHDDEHGGAALQHQDWVQFQKSIAVDGFETGQTTDVISTASSSSSKPTSSSKSRALALRRRRRDELDERIQERARLTRAGGGEYPPLRYSDEETQRLLNQAYAAIPARGGKRGTRNIKRQQRRWHLVRQIRKRYKRDMMRFQERKMQARSDKIASVKQVLQDAPDINARDRLYQLQVLQHIRNMQQQSSRQQQQQQQQQAEG